MQIPIKLISAEEQNKILEEKLQKRVDVQKLVHESNPNYSVNRELIKDLCKNDFVYFCDNFLWLQDPESELVENKIIPFLLYSYQEESAIALIKAATDGYDLPCEKTRKMGLSWLVCAVIVYGWNFLHWDCLIGSRTADAVDIRGDVGTLIEKCRYMISQCPEWLVPHLNKKQYDKQMLLIHPEHGAKIKGGASSPNFGRGDRSKILLLDEYSAWEKFDKAAWTSSSSTAKCRVALSTPSDRGKNCHYYTVVKNAKDKDLPYLRLLWTLHPVFADGLEYDEEGNPTSPWFRNEVNRATSPTEVAQEISINYDVSATGKVFPDFDLEKNVVENLEYNPNLPLYISWDFGLDQTALIWYQVDDKNRTIYIIDEYVNDGKSREGSDIYSYIDVVDNKPYQPAIHFGDPHSGNNRNLAARGASNSSILIRSGIRFKKFKQIPKISQRIAAGRNILDKIIISDKCILTIDMFSQWQLKRQQSGNASGSIPEHDIHSHIGDSFSYFAYGYQEKKQLTSNTTNKRQFSKTSSGVTS
ncbi:hypothetical protein HGB13_00155 [bacterium]|nr:hypothetical protein [bacterium]